MKTIKEEKQINLNNEVLNYELSVYKKKKKSSIEKPFKDTKDWKKELSGNKTKRNYHRYWPGTRE